MIGRVGERRITSLNPARMNAMGMPVQAKAGSISLTDLGSTGYPSTNSAPFDLAYSLATRKSSVETPFFYMIYSD